MQITRINPFTGDVHTMNLQITEKQIFDWKNGTLLQSAFPNLSIDEREFLKTGITPDTWPSEPKPKPYYRKKI